MKYLAIIPLIFSLTNLVTGMKVRDLYKSDNISPMKISFGDARREATFGLPPTRIIVLSDAENRSPVLVRFVINYLSLKNWERRDIQPFLARENVQVSVSDQPSNTVATKCVFFNNKGQMMGDDENLLIDGVFDAGTTVTKPKYAIGTVCDAYYFEPSPNDILRNLHDKTLSMRSS